MEIIKIIIHTIKTGRRVVPRLLLFITLLLFADKTFSQKAVRFDSTGDYIEAPHDISLAPSQLTVEFWLKVDGTLPGNQQTILDKRGGSAPGYILYLMGDQFPLRLYATLDPIDLTISRRIDPNMWYHIAITQDSDSARSYFNGQLIMSLENEYTANTTTSLRIGEFLGYPDDISTFKGEIDELRIWNYARSQDEVQSTMHEKLVGSEDGLAAYWDFDSLSGMTIKDLSPNGNDGTLNGNATLIDSDAPVGFIPPIPPVGLRAYGGEQSVELAWKPGESDISAYEIFRGESIDFLVDSVSLLATVSAPDSTYTDNNVETGRNYSYRLRAINDEHHASQPGRLALTRTLSVQSEYLTGVYYYPWYGPIDAHGLKGEYVRDFLIPRQPPMLNHYSSRDAMVIQQHLDWMKTYGIDFLVSSWWGQNTGEDITLRDFILPEIINSDIKFTIYYESAYLGIDENGIVIDTEKEEQLVSDFNYIAETFFSHPNFLRIEGKPAIFIYLSSNFSGNYEQAFTRVRNELQTKGYDLFLVGDEVSWDIPSAAHMQFLDAVSPYLMVGNPEYAGYAIDRDFFADISSLVYQWEKVAHAEGKFVIPNVHPGFNNLGVGGSAFITPRQSQAGAECTSRLEEYVKVMRPFIDPKLKMIMITSWNEWHEDTQIEPTIVTSATNIDNSVSGSFYTQGYSYKGYGFKALEVIRRLLSSELPIGFEETPGTLPSGFELSQNYPNPFNPNTSIKFAIPRDSQVKIEVFDVHGRRVVTLLHARKSAGYHVVDFDGGRVAKGLYFYAISSEDFYQVKKMLLVK